MDDHHGSVIQGLGDDPSAHDDYYARYPRDASGMVEKSKKNPPCDAKFGEKRLFVGERLPQPDRARPTTNDLRAAQAARGRATSLVGRREASYDRGRVRGGRDDRRGAVVVW